MARFGHLKRRRLLRAILYTARRNIPVQDIDQINEILQRFRKKIAVTIRGYSLNGIKGKRFGIYNPVREQDGIGDFVLNSIQIDIADPYIIVRQDINPAVIKIGPNQMISSAIRKGVNIVSSAIKINIRICLNIYLKC